MYTGLSVKCPLLLLDFNESWIFSTDFQKYSNIKFNENPSSGSRIFPMRMDENEKKNMTKTTVAFSKYFFFSKSPKTAFEEALHFLSCR